MDTKDRIIRIALVTLSALFGLSLLNLIGNSPLTLSQIFDYSGFVTGRYGFEISGYLGWTYLLTFVFLSVLGFTIYTIFKQQQELKKNNKESSVKNKNNNLSSNLNNKLFPGSVLEPADKKKESIVFEPKPTMTKEAVVAPKKPVETLEKEVPQEIIPTDTLTEQNKIFNDGQQELLYNNNMTDGISDMMLDFSPVELSPDGTEKTVYDDEKYISHFSSEIATETPSGGEKTLADQITEKLTEQIAGFYNKTSFEMQSYFSTLGELQTQIVTLREELAKAKDENSNGREQEQAVEESKQEAQSKEMKLARLKQMEKEANLLKDMMLEEQKKESQESTHVFRYKGF